MQWPREGALAARMQLQAQAQAEKAAKAAAWQAQEAAQQPPEAAQQHARTPSARLAQRPPTEPKEDSPAPLKEESASVEQMDIENETVQPPTDLRSAAACFNSSSSLLSDSLRLSKVLQTMLPEHALCAWLTFLLSIAGLPALQRSPKCPKQ